MPGTVPGVPGFFPGWRVIVVVIAAAVTAPVIVIIIRVVVKLVVVVNMIPAGAALGLSGWRGLALAAPVDVDISLFQVVPLPAGFHKYRLLSSV